MRSSKFGRQRPFCGSLPLDRFDPHQRQVFLAVAGRPDLAGYVIPAPEVEPLYLRGRDVHVVLALAVAAGPQKIRTRRAGRRECRSVRARLPGPPAASGGPGPGGPAASPGADAARARPGAARPPAGSATTFVSASPKPSTGACVAPCVVSRAASASLASVEEAAAAAGPFSLVVSWPAACSVATL